MPEIKIIAVETATPKNRWSQQEISECALVSSKALGRTALFYQRFLSDPGIKTRYFGLDNINAVYEETADESIHRFERVAAEIGSTALKRCLQAADLAPSKLDGLIVTTCTGYLCPGLTSYLSEKAGLRGNIFSMDMAGTGCGAALPAMRAAAQFLKSHPNSRVMVVCAEVCSAAFAWGDEIDLILSNAIFADGAAACLMSNHPADSSGLQWQDFEALLWPQYRDDLRFKHKDARLCNVIGKKVPGVAAEAVNQLHDHLKARAGKAFDHYGVHPGGRRILDGISDRLGFEGHELVRSREVLRDYGNMSSPSILFVLKKIWQDDRPEPGSSIALFAFGAGFSAFGVVLQVG